jgi:hypothetical protein
MVISAFASNLLALAAARGPGGQLPEEQASLDPVPVDEGLLQPLPFRALAPGDVGETWRKTEDLRFTAVFRDDLGIAVLRKLDETDPRLQELLQRNRKDFLSAWSIARSGVS